VTSVTTSIGAEWPFIGREGEIDQLQQMVSDPRQRGVVIAGHAGVGKTRVAQECLQAAESAGNYVARATATAGQRDVPLAALTHLIPASSTANALDRSDLLRQAQAALLEPAEHRRFVLLVDDAHLLDDTSATLLYQIIVANQAFVILTVRAEEPAPEVLVMAWKDEFVERIELAGLDDADVGNLLGAVLGHVDPDAVSILATQAEQNILVLRELVLGAVRDATLACTEGLWRLTRTLTPSARLIELIESRLHKLCDDDRALAEIVAVGEPLTLGEFMQVADADHAERLERQGILSCNPANGQSGGELEVRLAHPVYAEVIRARLPGLRTRSIAGQLADMLERSAPLGRDRLMRAGRLRLLSGGGDPQTLLGAAQAARWSYAFPFAERLARAALAAGACFEAELLAAELAGLQGRWRDADDQLCKLAVTTRTDGERARVAIARMDNYLYAGLAQEQLEVAHEADETVTDQHWRDEIRARSSPVLVMTKGPRATWSAVRGLLDRGDGVAFVWATLTGAHALGRMGATSKALELTEVGHSAQVRLREPIAWYPWFHLFNRCEVLLHAGRLTESEALGREQHRRAVADHSAEAQACFASQLALVLVARGRVETATRYARESFVIFRHLGRPMFMRQSAHRLAAALVLAGRTAEANEALQAAAEITDPAFMYDAVDLLHTRAWAAAADGHLPRARSGLTEVVRLADEIGDHVGLSIALHSSARLCNTSHEAGRFLARMAELSPMLDGTFFPARLAHVRGLSTEDPEILGDAAGMFAAVGADLLAAEAAADAASRWQVGGEPRRCAAASQLARSLLARCEGALTPALRSLDSRTTLTAAERDTAELAARGYSNKAIAEELVLSVRSVENRLQRTYEKLGINSREELQSALSFDQS
jgi:DNA-binding CsgD family transcriptional regulator